ncbi:MAG: hypothetical protein WKF92_03165 [Pyrinomonadaceae bacterium]
MPGVSFVPVRYMPNASVYKNENICCVNIIITERNAFKSVRTGFDIAAALRKMYPAEFNVDCASRLLVNAEFLEYLKRGGTAGNHGKKPGSRA